MGLIKSDKMENIKFFKESIVGILEDESATHIEYLKDFGEKIDELDKYSINFDNETYTSYMKSLIINLVLPLVSGNHFLKCPITIFKYRNLCSIISITCYF